MIKVINDIRKNLKRTLVFIFVAGLMMNLFSGCTSMQKWVKDNPKTVLGIGAGVVTGGLAGGIIGNQVGHTASGILIGSGLGAATGGLIGSAVEDKGTTSSR